MQYKGIDITLTEGTELTVKTDNQSYTVKMPAVSSGLIFSTSSVFGTTYSLNSEDALKMQYELIDENVK